MTNEKNFDFLKRMRCIHIPERRTVFRKAAPAEVEITEQWSISCDEAPASLRAARDFQDYLQCSMGLSLPLARTPGAAHAIHFCICERAKKRGAYEFAVVPDRITLTGDDARGVLRNNIHLEDLMNLAEGPYLQCGSWRHEPLLKMRLIHSGSEIDDFPDWQLDAIRHAGFTAIDLFVRDIDVNGRGEYCNINDVIERAETFGLDTILYNYLKCYKSPEDADADAVFDGVYGKLFRHYPGAFGISLVGESLEFPSRDERTTGKPFRESMCDGIPDPRPSPGWFPCRDYPKLLDKIEKSIHHVKPEADIVFSTYNWSYLSPKEREDFLAAIPKKFTINIAFEMQKQKVIDGIRMPVMDYTASVTEPGEYFQTEIEAAHRNGLPVRVCSNTGGLAWDVGCIPYLPVPQLWLRRMRALLPYVRNKGADRFYEGHHFGWWPNIANDLMKRLYETPELETDDQTFLSQLAMRDFGTREVVSVWEQWSRALTHITCCNEDQYGPLRVGAAYPLVFQVNITRTMLPLEIPFPCSRHAMFGNGIIRTLYQPYENLNQSPAACRYPIELRELEKMQELWDAGCSHMEQLIAALPEGRKHDQAVRLHALGRFISAAVRTTRHVKEWYMLNMQLKMSSETEKSNSLLDKLEALLAAEKKNAEQLLPYVRLDSRLGWEPSMGYVCDEWHLEWKLRQLASTAILLKRYRALVNAVPESQLN